MKAVHVPYAGGAPAVAAALGNHIDAVVLTLPTVVPPIVQGTLRGIGLASATRSSGGAERADLWRDGLRRLSGSWVGFFAPAKTPEAVIVKLNAEINAIMKAPDVQAQIEKIGFEPIFKTHTETEDYFKSEIATWAKMYAATGLQRTD